MVLQNKTCKTTNFIKLRDKYINKVWLTKKARINAASRLYKNYCFVQIMTILFSVLIIILTLFNLNLNDTRSVILLISSIILAFFSVFGTAQNYQERYIRMKDNYIRIENIETKINLIDDRGFKRKKTLSKYLTEYQKVLEAVENHDLLDYLVVKRSIEKQKTFEENITYTIQLVKFYLPKALCYLLLVGLLVSYLFF